MLAIGLWLKNNKQTRRQAKKEAQCLCLQFTQRKGIKSWCVWPEHYETSASNLPPLKSTLDSWSNRELALQGQVQIVPFSAMWQKPGPHSGLSHQSRGPGAGSASPSHSALRCASQTSVSPPAGWVPAKECMPDSTHGNQKPTGNQLCVRIFESASTGLRSLVDFASFAVVLILSWACKVFSQLLRFVLFGGTFLQEVPRK